MSLTTLIRTAALGAAAMYFLDPDRGRRRRAVAQDKARSTLRRGARFLDAAERDARNRLHGLQYRASRLGGAAWPPAVRLAAIAGGGAVAMYGLACSGLSRVALSAGGLALAARGAANLPLRELAKTARSSPSLPIEDGAARSMGRDRQPLDGWTAASARRRSAERPRA